MRTARQKKIIREIQQLHARRLPLNLPAIKRSHPKLVEQVYAVQPFWGWKRALEDAGLNYTKINLELRDYVDCRICGQACAILTTHLLHRHEATAEDYREVYPDAELVCETIRAEMSRRQLRKPVRLRHWEPMWSPEYVLDRMAELHRLKFPMNRNSRERSLVAHAIQHFGSWDNALRRIGLDPGRVRVSMVFWRGRSRWWQASKADILAEFHRRKRAGEPISYKGLIRVESGLGLFYRAKKLFGGWGQARLAAGLDPFGDAHSPWTNADRAAILAEIRRRKKAGERVRFTEVMRGKWGTPLLQRAKELFGSWNGALIEAGLPPGRGKSPWPAATKADIIAELRRRKKSGETLVTMEIQWERYGQSLLKRSRRLFGSWNAALMAVGLDPLREKTPWPQAGKAAILTEIRRRANSGESLHYGKLLREKGGSQLLKRARQLFGVWKAALLAAEVELPKGTTSPWPRASKAEVLREIRRRQRTGQSLQTTIVQSERWGVPFTERAQALFGSWTAALLEAGVDLPIQARSPWWQANKAEIVAEIRRRKKAGETLRMSKLYGEQWGTALLRAARRLFGSWNAALIAAGLEPVAPTKSPLGRRGSRGRRCGTSPPPALR